MASSLQYGKLNVFAGNPLIPQKRERVSTESLPKLLADTESTHPNARIVLPFLHGRPLISTKQLENGDIKWSLAWQSLEASGIFPVAEPQVAFPLNAVQDLVYLGDREGVPYFTKDVSDISEEESGNVSGTATDLRGPLDSKLIRKLSSKFSTSDGSGVSFVELRTVMVASHWNDAESTENVAIAGHARALLEWHKQVLYCGKCGQKTAAIEAGNRRQCTACRFKAYPRIDPVVIMLVIDKERDLILLGRQTRFVQRMWSCLAGFLEPGESLEEAVKRETREEVGLEVDDLVYHSSQPWPVGFGNMSCQLMIGFFAFAKTFDIVVDTKELQDARWFTREEVKAALNFTEYEENQKAALAKLHGICQLGGEDASWQGQSASSTKSEMFVPGPYAIAHSLVKSWVDAGAAGVENLTPLSKI